MPFIPISEIDTEGAKAAHGFIPLEPAEPERPSILKTLLLENPGTAIGETALNLGTMVVALPVAGLAGIGTAAAKALGLTEKDPADVVHAIGGALTYQPRGEFGKAATAIATAPFEALAKVGAKAGDATLDATDSPAAATAVDTAINAIPMAIAPAIKGARAVRERITSRRTTNAEPTAEAGSADAVPETISRADRGQPQDAARDQAGPRGDEGSRRGFIALDDVGPAAAGDGRGFVPLAELEEAPKQSANPAAPPDGSPAMKAGRYALIEADDIRASHDVDLRPVSENPFGHKGAARHENEMAVQEIVGKFEPPRLAEAMDDAGGAPIVARDGVVEAGQRRMIAIQRVYQADGLKAESYRQHLRENADSLGLDPAAIDQMRKPVLVRIPDEPAPRPLHAETLLNSMAETLRPIREQGQHLGDTLAQHGIEVDRLAPETREAIQFLHDNPERSGEFSARVQAAMDERRPVGADSSSASVQDMAAGVQNSWAPGQNYVPLRDAMPAAAEPAAAAKAAKLIRREDVLRPFLEALGVNPYWGRMKGKRLGYYMPKKEVLRVKNKSDLEVTAHEVGHLLDDRVPAIRAAWRNDKELREQLRGISYDKKSISEGYAEGVRLFLSNPEALEAAAPKVYGWLETFAETHEYGPALRKAQAGMTSWYEQSALDRGRSKIGDPTSLKNRPLLDWLRSKGDDFRKGFRQTVADDLDGIRLAELDLTGKLSPMGAYETARLSRAAASITDGAIRWGSPVKKADGSFTYTGKGLEEVLQPVAGKLDDFITYSVGRSATELLQQGREHLLTAAEAKSMTALETPEFRKAFAELQTWQRGVTDFAESLGLLNPETRKLWKRIDYIPFFRVEQGISGRGDVSGAWSGIKALKGGAGNLREPLQNIIQNAATLIGAALKNDARLRVVEMIEKEQGGGKFMQKIPAESRQVKVDAKQVQDAVLKGLGIADRASLPPDGAKYAAQVEKQIAEAPEFYQFFVGGQTPKGSNVVAVMKAGKPEYYEVAEPLLLRALTAIDRPVQNWVIKLLGWPRRIGQASIVLDPAFMAANFTRDQVMAGIMTQSGFRPLIDAMDGMRRRVTQDPLYREWVANGGGLSSQFLEEPRLRAKLEHFYESQGIDYRTVIDSPKKFVGLLETFGDAFESATRIGSFKRSLEKGEHPRHAAYESREVSVDFSMSGDAPAIRAAYDLVMFLRPTVVSWDRLYRGVVHDPNRGAIAAKTAMLGLASAALYLMNRGDPRYDDMPDFLKDSHFHVFLGDHHFMIPRPFEPGAIGRIAEVAVERTMTADPWGMGKDLARIISNTFHLNLMPQIVAPLVEQYANKSSFTGAPIETPDHANVQPFLRDKPGTSETMKAAGMASRDLIPDAMKGPADKLGISDETFQVNPVRAEALLRGYLNSWAMYGLMASDRFVVGKNLPEMRTDEKPVVRRFYRDEPQAHTKFESEFYEMLSASKRLRGSLKELDQMGLPQIADEKEKSPLAGEAKPLERAAKNLGAINKDMEQVRRDPGITSADKRQKLDALTVERNALLKDAVTAAKAAQSAKAITPADVARRGVFQ